MLLVEIEDEFHSKCTNEPRDEYRACGLELVYVFLRSIDCYALCTGWRCCSSLSNALVFSNLQMVA